MGTRANNDVTAGARSIMDYCKKLQAKSGLTATEFAAECGFSRNYWFVRARYGAPLTISDCERIAKACGMTTQELFRNALIGEPSSAQPYCYGLAANMDENRDVESETPDD